MAITIKFLGGVGTVTGSSHLVTNDRSEVLLDAGLFQGARDISYKINTTFNFNPHKLNGMVLSHAHVDHCGNIPNLVKKGMRCKIYATAATRDLCKIMLADSGKIQEEDIRYVNKINRRLGLPLRNPLYTTKDAANAAKHFHALAYNQKFCAARNVCGTLYDAGHILGSAIVALELKNDAGDVHLGYAVDLGRNNLPLLNDPVIPKGLDYLIIESTYGGREHSPIEEAKTKLKDVIVRTAERKGKILIPAFTLERTQEVLYLLSELLKEKAIPVMPIYVDSPLATELTGVFEQHLDYMDTKTRQAIERKESPFEFLNLRYVRDQQESKGLNMDKRPMIIIAGSGMCESGRIVHHLKNNISESRNTILVVGYMARDTLGRKIVERSRIVRIFGVEYELNAEVAIINALSAHADKSDLLDFVKQCLPLKKVFLVHGDPEQTQAFYDTLTKAGINAYIPIKDEVVEL